MRVHKSIKFRDKEKMKVIRETIVAGLMIHHTEKITSGNHRGKRKPKRKVTAEKVKKNNMRLAIKKLWILLCANFDSSGSHMTLTYKDEPDQLQAKKDRENFIKRLSRKMKAQGKELKYVAVTEYENKRIHHHIVMNTCDVKMVSDAWSKGFVRSTRLSDCGDYHDLAEYLIKETEKTFRREDSAHKHRYSPSRNLVMPVVKREEISVSNLMDEPKPIKGYYVPKERIRVYEHPVTGMEHREWIELALAEPRKYKQWPRGKAVSGAEHFRIEYSEHQEEWRWEADA